MSTYWTCRRKVEGYVCGQLNPSRTRKCGRCDASKPGLRRTPLKAKPRSKGNRGELEVREILRGHGYFSARRNFQSGGQGGGDLLEGIPGVHLEVKHQETTKIWEWIAQANKDAKPTDIPAVVFRRNRSGWMACIPFEDLLGLVEAHNEAAAP